MVVVTNNLTVTANGTTGITVDTDAYTDADVIGGLLEFDVATAMGGGMLQRVRIADEDGQLTGAILYLFDRKPSTIADDAAFAPTIADVQKLWLDVTISSPTTVNSLNYWFSDNLNKAYTTVDGKLYGYLVANGTTPNFTNADALTIKLEIVTQGV